MNTASRIWNAVRPCLGALAVLVALSIAVPAFAASEDVIYMNDGRELHGQIVKETPNSIVFDYVNPDIGIKVTMTIPMGTILKIDRDVAVAAPEKPQEKKEDPASPAKPEGGGDAPTAHATSGQSKGDDVTSFYIVPMNGQVGTDIRSSLYEDVLEDIKTEQPDVVVIKIDSKNVGDDMLSYWFGTDLDHDTWEPDPYKRREVIHNLLDDELEIVKKFHFEIPKHIRQVVWVRDATGPAALLALGWEDMYMHPRARFGSLMELWMRIQFPDPDVRSKMELAWFSTAKGITQFGGHSEKLVEGLMDPEELLSFSCVGREPVWYKSGDPDFEDGDIILEQLLDSGFGGEVTFDQGGIVMSSRICEDFLISDGTAETIDDLAILLNYRQYQVMETEVLLEVAGYKEEWRGLLDRTIESLQDYAQYLGRGTLEDLKKAQRALMRAISAVRMNESVAVRIQSQFGVDLIQLEILLEDLKATIRQMTQGGRGGGGRGGGGGPGRGGGGPRP